MTNSHLFSPAERDPDTQLLNAELGATFSARRDLLGLSQRAYAERRGWSVSRVSQLENTPVQARLGHIVEALQGTGYALSLVRVDEAMWDRLEAASDAKIIPLRPRAPGQSTWPTSPGAR